MASYSYSFITLLALSAVSACQALNCGETDPATGWIPGPALSIRFDTSVDVNVGTSDKPISVRLDGDYYFASDEWASREYFTDHRWVDRDWSLDVQSYNHYHRHMVDMYEFSHSTPVDEALKDKWIIASRWSYESCFKADGQKCGHPKAVCPQLSEGECGQKNRMCHWTDSKCAPIPYTIVAVCESGCPTNTTWPKNGAFNPKWRLLNSVATHNGIGSDASGVVAGGTATCCKRKPQMCDGVKQSDCHSVAPSFPGCLPSGELLKGCCSVGLPDPFCWMPWGGSCDYTCSHKRAQLDIPDVCDHSPLESQQGKPALVV